MFAFIPFFFFLSFSFAFNPFGGLLLKDLQIGREYLRFVKSPLLQLGPWTIKQRTLNIEKTKSLPSIAKRTTRAVAPMGVACFCLYIQTSENTYEFVFFL